MTLKHLKLADPEIYKLVKKEEHRQKKYLQMIPSENIASKAVLETLGSVFTNKYSEGYPKKRYYQGNDFVDQLESLVGERVKKLFGVPYANVQPYSGSPANSAVYFAVLEQHDTLMGLTLTSGGHLTHGHPKVTFSGKYFTSVQYGLTANGLIDFDNLQNLAETHKPRLIVSGTTSYPRALDFKKFGEIADKVGAYHLADISHIAGLVVTGQHQSPVDYADIIMFTTHKTLRGPRGAAILVTAKGLAKDPLLPAKIDKAIIPGMQGGPHNNVIAAMGVAFKEAEKPEFKTYCEQVVINSKTLAEELTTYGFDLVSGGTDNHLILIDLTAKKLDGWCAAWALEYAGIICNRNVIPSDDVTQNYYYTSGLRMGTPTITSRGMKENEMRTVASLIHQVVDHAASLLSKRTTEADMSKDERANFKILLKRDKTLRAIKAQVVALTARFA